MSTANRRPGLAVVLPSAWAALQWRLLLLWLAGLLLPTAIVALPIWRQLSAQLDSTLHVAHLASQFDGIALADLLSGFTKGSSLIGASALLATGIALLISPLLTGLSIAAIRARHRPGFGELVHGAVSSYGRLLRLLLWSLVPLGAALALGALALKLAGKHADQAILASQVDATRRWATGAAVLLFLFAHATVEAARAQLAVDTSLRSAIRAWWRGLKLVLRRPVAMLGSYLAIAVLGLGLAAIFGVWRIGIGHPSFAGFALALLATQLLAASVGWMRSARLFAFARIAAANR